MRIIAGQWRGRPLQAPPKNPDGTEITRPTADRAREALFSILTARLGSFEGLSVLDGFAGTGALGLEALSRGAAHAIFVESSSAAARTLAANIQSLGAGSSSQIITSPVARLPRAAAVADLVMLDPPYGAGLAQPALAHLLATGWLGPASLISVETSRTEPLEAPGFTVLQDRTYGKARLHLLQPG